MAQKKNTKRDKRKHQAAPLENCLPKVKLDTNDGKAKED